MGDEFEGKYSSLKTGIVDIAMESYDQGVADERKRCFDLATERMQLFIKSMKSWSSYPGSSYQLMEAMIISERIDNESFLKLWKKDEATLPKTKWFITGGVYKDTTFRELQTDVIAEEYGPYDTYQAAYEDWKYKVFLNVDNALHRLTVVERLSYD